MNDAKKIYVANKSGKDCLEVSALFGNRRTWIPTSSKWNRQMARHIKAPTIIAAQGNLPKEIQEFVGRVNTGTSGVSVARMISAAGWQEPGQRPEFDEYTMVLRGAVHIKLQDSEFTVRAGEAVIIEKGSWVQYSTPEGAEYISVCMPAFSPDTVHRDME
jgi:mannose-6-phosphate isomerase-like protein (cupin superfamily)